MEKDKKDNLDFDFESSIKDHLNASFEKENVSVSDELFEKTLKAINNKESIKIEPVNKMRNARVWVTRLASVAAVALVLLISIKVIGNNVSYKSDTATDMVATEESTSVASSGTEGATSFAEGSENIDSTISNSTESSDGTTSDGSEQSVDNSSQETDQVYSFTQAADATTSTQQDKATIGIQAKQSDQTASEPKLGSAKGKKVDDNSQTADSSNSNADSNTTDTNTIDDSNSTESTDKQSDENAMVSESAMASASSASYFNELYKLTSDQVVSFSVTNNETEKTFNSENTAEAGEFLSILNEYKLTNLEKNISDTWYYEVELKTKDNEQYTIMVGDGIQVNLEGNNSSSSGYYTAQSSGTLLERIKNYYNILITK